MSESENSISLVLDKNKDAKVRTCVNKMRKCDLKVFDLSQT